MPRRFTVTEKWTQDKWFMELNASAKLMFFFLCENCDCAGFWEINIKEAAYRMALNEETVYQAFRDIEKCYVRDDRFCAIVSFLHHQRNLPLNPENKAHIGILNRLISHPGLYEALKIRWESKGYIQSERTLWNQAPSKPLQRGYGKGRGLGDKGSLRGKPHLYPIPGRNCSVPGCGMPAVYRNSSGTYDTFKCLEHLPEKVKAVYC
ncbi:MAG: hypothetical protein CEE38_14450 [Planctomycetes bacterium B3_Pla]|nr:MAG: hypothetical protein CEE38_14450 [Planctomycetes bacterium B3_Pla]